MNILNALIQLRDDIKAWVTNNLNALNAKIEEKTIPIDKELSATSTNPVQNKTITEALNNVPRFSGDYNDLTNAPNIAEDNAGNMVIADESGNVIFKADAEGIHTTALSLNGEHVATESYVDEAIANIDFPETDLTGYYTKTETDTALENLKAEISESIVSESEEWIVSDNDGNIIVTVDADGLETTTVTAHAMVVNGADVESKFGEMDTHVQNDGIHVTAAEKEAWNNKSEFSGSYTDLSNVPTDLATQSYVDDAVAGVTSESIGLGNVDNTSDVDKPVSTATQSALNELKTELSESIVAESEEWKVVDGAGNIVFSVDASGAHTTAMSLNGIDVEDIIDQRVSSLVDSAPETLNTLNELAAALGDDPNFATTVATEIGKKVDKEDGKGLSTNDFTNEYKTKLDGLENLEETDPTVPAWAKAENPPALSDLEGDESHRTVTDAEKAVWNAKSDFSGNYSDLNNAPNITEDDSGNLVIADNSGNIIFRSDANGFETTTLTVQSMTLNGADLGELIKAEVKSYVDAYILGGEW